MGSIANNDQSVEDVLRYCQLHGTIDLDDFDVDAFVLTCMKERNLITPVVYELTEAGHEELKNLSPPSPIPHNSQEKFRVGMRHG